MTEEKENNTNIYININRVANAKGLKSNRSLRLEINKPESKYVAREVKVNGGTSYEILYSSLEPEIQQKLRENSTKSTALTSSISPTRVKLCFFAISFAICFSVLFS